MSKKLYSFKPDWGHEVIPGDSIVERMSDINLSKTDFARNMGYSDKHIYKIIKGEASITEDTALKLEKVLDIPASFWMNLESNYRQALAQEQEKQVLLVNADWLKQIPLKNMIKLDWVTKFTDTGLQIQECLRFYGVASVDAWHKMKAKNYQVIFKSSDKFNKNDIAIQTWLRQGEIEAQKINCNTFNKETLRNSLDNFRQLTLLENIEDFLPKLTKLCAECGIAVIFTPTPENCPMSGATKWLSKDKALLLLSLRYKTNDHLWFAFFHEIAHILKHKKQLFLEGKRSFVNNETLETEANNFSADILIPKEHDLSFLKTKVDVINFAKKIKIAPGIVVGRMQHKEIIPWDRFNDLKITYIWESK
ncbi:Antitoxin HigA / unknown domain [uncultured Gammaproteobacteria bacterium]|nr:Antitoxin HigA / unknown domain [uncultured Gammaproteobacteria bacterium]